MKRVAIALAFVGTLLPVALRAQSPPTPGPEHKKLEIWVGDWTSEGRDYATPLGPAGSSSGKVAVRSILGGFSVQFDGEWKSAAGVGRWHEFDGYDPATKKYMWFASDSFGGLQMVTYTIDGTNVVYDGTTVAGGKRYPIKGTVVFAPDFKSYVEKREVSLDGRTWMPLWESKATKTK